MSDTTTTTATPRRKRHILRWVLLGFAALVIISAIAGAGKHSTSTTTVTPAASDTPAAATGVASDSSNTAHAPTADVDPGWACTHTDVGPDAHGTVTNHSSKVSTYTINVDFTDGSGVRVDNGMAIVNEVQPGQTAKWDAQSFDDSASGVHCTLTKVDRNGF